MNRNELYQFLSNNINGKLGSGGTEFICRCPYCGDSKNLSSAHFYISLPNDDKPVFYNCFKCNSSGVLNANTLRDLGVEITDSDVISDLVKRNKKINGNYIRGSNNKSIFKFKVDSNVTMSNKSEYKISYINKRLGLNFGYEDIVENKIILNLLDIYNNPNNKYLRYTRDERIIRELDDSFIGFLGFNNGIINMRNLKNKNKYSEYLNKRYVNYNLFPTDKLQGTSKYYILPTIIDAASIQPIKIHIAEGPFDVLSICYNLHNGNKMNSIYASIDGNAYINLIKFFLIDLKIINVEFHIYFDNDVKESKIHNLLYQLKDLNLDIYFHWNRFVCEDGKFEKDYGVPKFRILDYFEHVIIQK